jgi:hypothetical protein
LQAPEDWYAFSDVGVSKVVFSPSLEKFAKSTYITKLTYVLLTLCLNTGTVAAETLRYSNGFRNRLDTTADIDSGDIERV